MKIRLSILFFIATIDLVTGQVKHKGNVAGFEYYESIKGKGDTSALPLLIAFHYSSGSPEETVPDYDLLKLPVRIIIPRGNYAKRAGYSYFPLNYYETDTASQYAISRSTVDSLAVFVKEIEREYGSRAIVSGISQGGDISFMLAFYYPELCRASFPFAAVLQYQMIRDLKSGLSNNVPIHLYQGEADKIVPVKSTTAKVALLKRNLNIRFITYPGVGHEISREMKKDYSEKIDVLNSSPPAKEGKTSKTAGVVVLW
jgi:phospholipase/carboxylesterase